MTKLRYATLASRPEDESNVVDRVIDRQARNRRRDRKLAALSMDIVAALSERRALWLDYERLANQRRDEREAAAFDLGVEHGRADERATRVRASRAIRALSEDLRARAPAAPGVQHDAVAALLLAAWTLLGPTTSKPTIRAARRSR